MKYVLEGEALQNKSDPYNPTPSKTVKFAYCTINKPDNNTVVVKTVGDNFYGCRGYMNEILVSSKVTYESLGNRLFFQSRRFKNIHNPFSDIVKATSYERMYLLVRNIRNVDNFLRGIKMLNKLELKHKWYRTSAIKVVHNEEAYFFITASKNWFDNTMLSSAFFLLLRTSTDCNLEDGYTFKDFINNWEKMPTYNNNNVNNVDFSMSDREILNKLSENPTLIDTIMTYRKKLAEKLLWKEYTLGFTQFHQYGLTELCCVVSKKPHYSGSNLGWLLAFYHPYCTELMKILKQQQPNKARKVVT